MYPFFSIIIPVYDVAPYLRECLDSVMTQSFDDWEAICVDDGSTDGSGDILDEYAAKDKRFHIIHQPNAGVSAARNTALNTAKGKWVCFLDADDVWLDWLLRDIHACILSTDAEWIRMERCAIHFNSDSPPTIGKQGSHKAVLAEDTVATGWNLISRQSFPFLNFYARNTLGDTRFNTGVRFREDALFCFEMTLKVRRLCLTDISGYCRRMRAGSATFSSRGRSDTANLLDAYMDLWENTYLRNENATHNSAVIAATTFWVEKDVREWLFQCPDRTIADAWKVTRLVRRLYKEKAICPRLDNPNARRRLRWKLYLATGFWWIMVASRHNPFGNPLPVKAGGSQWPMS